MQRLLSLVVVILFLYSCNNEPETKEDTKTPETEESSDKLAFLEKENARKDSMINESLQFFNEIQSNLEAIEVKKDELRIRSSNKELSSDDKKWIIEQIKHINYLREENARKVQKLSKQLKDNDIKIKELNKMIDDVLMNIRMRDEQIGILQDELGSLDKAYSRLFDAYQEKSELAADLEEELNTVYYSYGTEDELAKNKVIERKNGFIGIGKSIALSDNFNEKYFAKIDMREEKEIFVEGKELKFITDHPSQSYRLVSIGKNTNIKIIDPQEFWKVSNYLVVVVE